MCKGAETALVLAALFTVCGCGSDHHVSPWSPNVSLRTLTQPGNLAVHVARIDDEMRAEELVLDVEIKGVGQDEEPYQIRSYKGHDELGNTRWALRVATRFGVIMALGPSTGHEVMRGEQSRLVHALGKAGQWQSGTDVNGDGLPDVFVSRGNGHIEVWGFHAQGASPYPIESIAPISDAIDVDADGRPDLLGYVPIPVGDVLAPRLIEVLTFSGGRYHAATPSVRSFHRRHLSEKTGLTARIERAWHSLRAGKNAKEELAELDKELDTLPAELSDARRHSFESWIRWLRAYAVVSDSSNKSVETTKP